MQKVKLGKNNRVLMIEPCYENFGGYFRAFNLASALSKKGIHVDLVLSSRKKFFIGIAKKRINPLLTQYELPRIEISFLVNGRILRGIINCFFILFKRYDIIHFFTIVQLETTIPFLLFILPLKKRIVIDWDDYWSGINKTSLYYNKFGGILMRFFQLCEYRIQKLALHATTTSNFLLKELKKIGVKNTLKIINCVNEEEYTPISRTTARKQLNIDKNQKMLLTFGNTFFRERTVLLLRFIEKIVSFDTSIQLYMNIDPKHLIFENAQDFKFSESIFRNITTVGYLDKKKLAQYIGATDAIIFFMGDSTYEKACFPIRIGTFLNGGRTIVINDTNTEASRILNEYGCAVTEKDINALASKTVKLLNNKNEQLVYEKKSLIAKRELLWSTQINKLIAFYSAMSVN